MAELTSSLKGESGGDSEEELAGFIENMMTQLMSKEILYDPLQELSQKVIPVPCVIQDTDYALSFPNISRRTPQHSRRLMLNVTSFNLPPCAGSCPCLTIQGTMRVIHKHSSRLWK